MPYYFAKAKPFKDDFMTNSTPEEDRLMGQHFQYLKSLQKEGKLYLAGPVVDEGTPYGIYIFNVEDREEAQRTMEQDPSIQAGIQSIVEVREVRLSLNPLQDEYPKPEKIE